MAKTPTTKEAPAADQAGLPVEPTASEIMTLETRQDETDPLKWHFKAVGGKEPATFDFGDGQTHTPADGRNTAHTYAAEGEYHAKATDADGLAAETDVYAGVRGQETAYEQALAFKPDPWDQLPDDLEVRSIYLALNGHINFFIKRRA
jgi:hypothetical protein